MSEFVKIYSYGGVQEEYCKKINKIYHEIMKIEKPVAYVKTYGCQQNVSDSEKLKGMLSEMGFTISCDCDKADIILFNTCAIRENAENKVFGNLGRVKAIKKKNPNTIIILCGCMTEQEPVVQKIKLMYPFVDLIFGTHSAQEFPKMLYDILNKNSSKGKLVHIINKEDSILENAPLIRNNKIKAFISIMSGCNNFCSYCIVPYVRGRERSRRPEAIIKEFKLLLEKGYKDLTLLGQNVNSYGKDLEEQINFPSLLKKLDDFKYEYKIRFMTSHPKDATKELVDVIANSKHIARNIHLPVQSGSNQILKRMNRKYTKESYLEIIEYAKEKIPNVTFSSDIIVGFPGETYEDFCETLELIKNVKFSSLFTFIYSPREGTPAATLPDPVSKKEKTKWLLELLKVQESISQEICKKMVGREERVLAENYIENEKCLMCRSDGNIILKVPSNTDLSGEFINVNIVDSARESLMGSLI